ncbi:MAG: CBS domain-containing protein [Planctomycetota bacterium]|nr:MAG: CBS domain-containing protein [Planctomycetota bacterium]REJ97295.1 MAG: CBS domain-containing protein [Planctomycetota bacterium]REK23043.1 MAG: CBS domain-containing protein [Planctomycetota bacterium]REK34059.1 MAG: CBS domain-containing protein [Planctomycetota bacterium]
MSEPRIARHIMVTRLVTLSPQMPVVEGVRKLLRNNITGAPVLDPYGRFLAIFAEKSCLTALVAAQQTRSRGRPQTARDIMVRKLITLTPDMDVIDAIGLLLKNRISGAPVLERDGSFVGVFSERTSMQVLLDAAYDQHPTAEVGAYMNPDPDRAISEETPLKSILELFVETPYRRLEVMRGRKVVGQISRRDAIRAAFPMLESARGLESPQTDQPGTPYRAGAPLAEYMDADARTIDEEASLLEIAQIFLNTNHRRLPVIRDGELAGQISRRDLLSATHAMLAPPPQQQSNLLYLSGIVERHEAPVS